MRRVTLINTLLLIINFISLDLTVNYSHNILVIFSFLREIEILLK